MEGVEGRKEEEYDSEERGKEERGGGCFNILSKPGLGYGGKKVSCQTKVARGREKGEEESTRKHERRIKIRGTRKRANEL